ncbi:MAG: dihydroneopterin aldolase [Anaerolineales bacterium]|nr:dihydroneopterin aldolase [Anaerolineales bacterium]
MKKGKETFMDQVFINDLIARGIIGINDWEREKPQEIRINIILYADLHKAGESDNIEDCVNYRTVSKKVLYHAENAQRLTVEALAADLAKLCLEDSRVAKVRVKVEKPGAARFARSVGVEIERSQAE